MKISRKLSLALCLSVVSILPITTTSMASDCADAEILKVGAAAGVGGSVASDNVIAVKCISDTTWGTYAQFYPNIAIADQALATALTALSLGKHVWIRTSAITSGSILNTIYVNK
jgi:hypothetical protein